ncbi:MAG: SIMPL domain-containing protein [Clostridiaceae bacterium]|nr:SIMPL domain-containing protein [Clostridiaceae bacterium]
MNQENKKSIAFILVALILSAGLIISTFIVTDGIVEIKGNRSITVTGSAKQQIKSDLIEWTGSFSCQSQLMPEAYTKLKADSEKVKKYLKEKGISEEDMVFSSIDTNPIHEVNYNGQYTNNIIAYRLYQRVQISSTDVDTLSRIAREATELINEGIEFQSYSPQYYYTKIADLKVSMLAEATKDAKNRAEQISQNTGSNIGALKSAKMGVFQITPLYSTEVSDYGINDTSSLDKEITAVVTCTFEMK